METNNPMRRVTLQVAGCGTPVGTAMPDSEETLRQIQKMEAIRQISGTIGHDMNNLLQSIVAPLELARHMIRAGRGGETEQFLVKAVDLAKRAGKLNNRLLVFSRRRPLNPKPLALNALIAGMEELLRHSLPPTVQLELALAPELWETCCDHNQAETALLSLLLNAREALPGRGTITIGTVNVEVDAERAARIGTVTPGQYVCIAVADRGKGMSRDVAERAFDAHFSEREGEPGMGLGLTMVRRFARQNDGEAAIDSEAGNGTTVTIYLPRNLPSK